MLRVPDDRILRVVPNYFINLIAPANIDDGVFGKFHTDLGLAMKVIKYQKGRAVEIIESTNHRKIDRNTAEFLNKVVNLNLIYEEPKEEGEVDMCLAMEKKSQRDKITGAIEILRDDGISDEAIAEKIIKKFNVTREYVLALLAPQKV